MTPDTSGPAWLVPSAYYDPEACCWKTSGVMFPSDWPTSSQTCPAWGMTRRGELFELPTPVLPTDEPASSSLLGTPRACSAMSGSTMEASAKAAAKNGPFKNLEEDIARLVATPVATAATTPTGTGQPVTTPIPASADIALLPTPVVNDMGEGKTPQDWDDWTSRMQARHGNGNGHGASLSIEAQRLLPTPMSSLGRGTGMPSRDTAHLRQNVQHKRNLDDAVALLPTPTVDDSKNVSRDSGWDGSLTRTARALLPTPTAQDYKGPNQRGDDTCLHGALLPTPRATRGGSGTETMYSLGAERTDAGRPQGEVLLPTPTAQDAAGSRNSTHPRPPGSTANIGDTLTDAATVLTGARTRARSDAGKESSADLPPDLLSLLPEVPGSA